MLVTGSVSRMERRKGRPDANMVPPTFINRITSAGRRVLSVSAVCGLVLVAFVASSPRPRRRGGSPGYLSST